MVSFCPHCGQMIEQEQFEGEMLICVQCGQEIGMVGAAEQVVDAPGKPTGQRCPACQQMVEVKTANALRTLAPHYAAASRKICPGSGKKA